MKKLKCFMVAALLTAALTQFPGLIAAEESPEGREESARTHETVHLKYDKMRPHLNFYYELLIERYEPAMKEEWLMIVQELETLIKKYREMKKEGKLKDKDFHNQDDKWKMKHQDVQEQFLKAVKERNDEAIRAILPDLVTLQKEMNEYLESILKTS
ncbi:hypothetical protein [Alteribacter natronophilus]|uniref:hypothetical protein n=1 Tax=Alteribacter natronophilus TaxID=2583810 RepID=UPI00110E17E7|nr:hypothetical protein [Alteribacter natronophilus]TMW73727.1 hypothetical protein FGB90_05400 [Alteribacter natronophilus]